MKNLFNKIKEKIEDITLAIKNLKLVRKYKSEEKEKNTEKINREINFDDINKINKEKKEEINMDKNSEKNCEGNYNNTFNIAQQISRKNKKKRKKKKHKSQPINLYRNLIKNPPKKELEYLNNINLDIFERGIKNISKNSNNNLNNINLMFYSEQKEIIMKSENIMKCNDEELNNGSYEFAIKYDSRNYFQFYFSLLLTKHSLISTFFNENDYNIKIIKN